MNAILICLATISGLAIGSFLNVVIWRVPRGESVVSPASSCPKCGTAIRGFDNVPVVSWLLLRGRCRTCDEMISSRYPLLEIATALLFAGVTYWFLPLWTVPAFLYLMAISVALFMIDIDVRRLPNVIVLPSYLVGLALLSAAVFLGEGEAADLVRACLGMILMLAVYLTIFVAANALFGAGGMGFGDVKLAGVLGLYLGFLGWKELAVGWFAAFLVGGLVGIALLAAGRRRVRVPFGPYMLGGAWLGIYVGEPLANWYLQLAQMS